MIEKSQMISTTEPSMRVSSTSMPVRGPKSVSASCAYCESHEMLAPRLTIPGGVKWQVNRRLGAGTPRRQSEERHQAKLLVAGRGLF